MLIEECPLYLLLHCFKSAPVKYWGEFMASASMKQARYLHLWQNRQVLEAEAMKSIPFVPINSTLS